MKIDFGKTARDYGRYRAGFPGEFFDHVFSAGFVRSGDRVLDLGTGTGTPARGFARRGCKVSGFDPAQPLLDEAKRLDTEAGVDSVKYVRGRAEGTGLAAESFDAVLAGQCWHWFDRSKAALEARRILRAGGRVIIAHFDWIPLPGNVVEATEELIEVHNPEWKLAGTTGLHPQWLADLSIAGFQSIETFSFDCVVSYSHEHSGEEEFELARALLPVSNPKQWHNSIRI